MRRRLASRLALLAAAAAIVACSEDQVRTVSPSISVELPEGAEALSFGKVPIGQRTKLELGVRSVRPVSLQVSEIRMESSDGVSHAAFSAKPAGGFSVGGGATEPVEVWFEPQEVRNYVAELVVVSNDPDHPEERVALRGEGIEGAIVLVGCLFSDTDSTRCPETLVEAPTTLDLGTVVAGTHQKVRATIQNHGVDSLDVLAVGFADETQAGADGFSLNDADRRATSIGRLSNKTFTVDFAPPLGASGDVEARVVVASSDRRKPEVELPLRAKVVPNQPPRACLTVREIRTASGQVRAPGAGPVVVEPTETVILDADVRAGCTGDPEDGQNVGLEFGIQGPDDYGRLQPETGFPMRRAFRAEVIGTYTATLRATDSLGASATADENGAAARAVFEVVPRQDIAVELRWPDGKDVDLDLHFVRENDGLGGIDKLWSSTNDCAIRAACKPGFRPQWGAEPPVTSPLFAFDDQGGAARVETVLLNGAEPGASYWVFAHYYEDRRVADRPSAPSCTSDAACAGGKVCVAGKCMPPVEATIRIFTKGNEAQDDALGTRVPLDRPCDIWLAAKVIWPADAEGPVVVQPYGSDTWSTDDPVGTICPTQ